MTQSPTRRLRSLAVIVVLCLTSFVVGTAAGLYQYPRTEFDRITQRTLETSGGMWRWNHLRRPVDASFRDVVKPAVDFLYSSAVLDATHEPHVLSIPAMDRYYVFQFLERDTDVFECIGSRTHDRNQPLDVLIVPQGYHGPTHDLHVVELKTQVVWLLARFQLLRPADASHVHTLQDQCTLTPLSRWIAQDTTTD